MEAYLERIKSNAENLAKDVFPKKALELDEIINVILNLITVNPYYKSGYFSNLVKESHWYGL